MPVTTTVKRSGRKLCLSCLVVARSLVAESLAVGSFAVEGLAAGSLAAAELKGSKKGSERSGREVNDSYEGEVLRPKATRRLLLACQLRKNWSPYQGAGAPKVFKAIVGGQETPNEYECWFERLKLKAATFERQRTTACGTAQRWVNRIPWLPIRATTAWSC
jgi:hypothetical protein